MRIWRPTGCRAELYHRELSRSTLAALLCLLFPVLQGCPLDGSDGEIKFSVFTNTADLRLAFLSPLSDSTTTVGVGQTLQPGAQVKVLDNQGRLVSDGRYSISLAAYTDSACTIASGNNQSSVASAISQSGIATFVGLSGTQSGTYYLKAYSSGMTSACSKALILSPGAADHLKIAATTPSSVVVGSSAAITVQTVDSYGNPTPPPAGGAGVVFSSFVGGGFSSQGGSFDANGFYTGNIPTPSSGRLMVIRATPSGVASVTPLIVPIYLDAAPATQFQVLDFPSKVLLGSSQWAKVIALDANGNRDRNFSGTALVALGANTPLSVTFVPGEKGVRYVSLGGTATVSSAISAVSGSVSGSSGTVNVVNNNCGTYFNSNASGTWASPGNWGGTSPGSSDSATINAAHTITTATSATQYVSCLSLFGNLSVGSSGTLNLTGSSGYLSSGASLTAGSGGGMTFSGTGPQIINTGGFFSIPALHSSNSGGGVGNAPLFFEGSGVSISNFTVNSSNPATIYVNSSVVISNLLTVPAGTEIVINPGYTLTLNQGALVQGKISIRGGGNLLIGGTRFLDVSGGTLELFGSPQTGPARIAAIPSTGGISIRIQSSGIFQATYFVISDLVSPGIEFQGSSVFTRLTEGVIAPYSAGHATVTFQSGATFNETVMSAIIFAENGVGAFTPVSVPAGGIPAFAMVDTYYRQGPSLPSIGNFGSGVSPRSRSNDPNGTLVWAGEGPVAGSP